MNKNTETTAWAKKSREIAAAKMSVDTTRAYAEKLRQKADDAWTAYWEARTWEQGARTTYQEAQKMMRAVERKYRVAKKKKAAKTRRTGNE